LNQHLTLNNRLTWNRHIKTQNATTKLPATYT